MSGAAGSSQWMYSSGDYYEYTIGTSLRLDSASVHNLQRTPSAGNRKTWTLSFWTKPSDIDSGEQSILTAGGGCSGRLGVMFDGAMHLSLNICGTGDLVETKAVYRDPSAWYHFVVVFDTTQGTATDRVKIYTNGAQQELTHNSSFSQNTDYNINNNVLHSVGALSNAVTSASYTYGGYLAEMHFIDGTAKAASDFGEAGSWGDWKPKEYTGSHGTQGWYLPFDDSGALGDDESDNTNDWTPTNLAATDQVPDSPTNNFCVINPLARRNDQTTKPTFSEGNLHSVHPNLGGNATYIVGTIGVTTGKWYYEVLAEDVNTNFSLGIAQMHQWNDAAGGLNSFLAYRSNGQIKKYTSVQSSQATYTDGDIIGIAFDIDNETIAFYKNNTLQDTISGSWVHNYKQTSSDEYHPMGQLSTTDECRVNYGSDSSFSGEKTAQGNQDANGIGDFYYTPPSGHLAICTSNLPAVEVTPSKLFNTLLYTGDGQATHAVTGVGFQPDFIWFKHRTGTYHHSVWDAVRGVHKQLYPSGTNAEADESTSVKSFDTDGFTLGSKGNVNDSAAFVAWNWKANGSGSSNTDGSINTTATSANVAAGFSISTYTGTGSNATVGHGLSKAPEMIICKRRNASEGWATYHHGIANDAETDFLELHSTGAVSDSNTRWNDTAPTSSVFSIGTHDSVNADSSTYVAYCFHSVAGYSKVAGYNGNLTTGSSGQVDGTYVFTGFTPAWVMIRYGKTSGTADWYIFDSARNTYNPVDKFLEPNTTDVEATESSSGYEIALDFLSSGFKLKGPAGGINSNGTAAAPYIYLAFAETPFKYANGR